MPKTKTESLIFAIAMTTGMVLIMSTYRMYVGAGALFFIPWLITIVRSWLIAFFLDKWLAHPLAMKVVTWSKVAQKAPKQTGNVISLVKCLFMTTVMSGLGMAFKGLPITLTTYPVSWMISIVVSIPASFLIVGPIARAILRCYQTQTAKAGVVEA